MAFTSPKMGLRIWNLLTDLYDHAQLADNWAKVDYHDHSPGKGVQIPTEGLADGAVTGPKLATALDPSGAYTTWTPVFEQATTLTSGSHGSGIWYLDAYNAVASSAYTGRGLFYIDPADYVASGRTAKLRLQTMIAVNAVAPAQNITLALASVNGVAGGAGLVTLTSTPAIAGATTVYTTPGASAQHHSESDEFDVPSAGYCVMRAELAGALAASSAVGVRMQLQVHYV
jgi:hypothetical protein